MKSKLIHILCLCVLLLGFTLKPEQARKPITVKLLTQTTNVVAQDRVQLRFETEAEDLKLLVSNALGSTVLKRKNKNKPLTREQTRVRLGGDL